MYFTQDSLLPENQAPLMITAAPFGPQWMPRRLPGGHRPSLGTRRSRRRWTATTPAPRSCTSTSAIPRPATCRRTSRSMATSSGGCATAVPKMILQIGGSISFAPEPGKEAHWQGYDTRHMLTEIDPKPDQITIVIGSSQMYILPLTTPDDAKGTSLENPAMQKAYQNMVADASPEFYIEHLKRLRQHQIQPYFQLSNVHNLEEIENLIRQGIYMGPLNHNLVAIGGGVIAGRNPFDFMEYVRRSPHGSTASIESLWRTVAPFCCHGRRSRDPLPGRHRGQPVAQEGRAHDQRWNRSSRSCRWRSCSNARWRRATRRDSSSRSESGTTVPTKPSQTLACRQTARTAKWVSSSRIPTEGLWSRSFHPVCILYHGRNFRRKLRRRRNSRQGEQPRSEARLRILLHLREGPVSQQRRDPFADEQNNVLRPAAMPLLPDPRSRETLARKVA